VTGFTYLSFFGIGNSCVHGPLLHHGMSIVLCMANVFAKRAPRKDVRITFRYSSIAPLRPNRARASHSPELNCGRVNLPEYTRTLHC
jgi:hypothetical protein